jgi:hypothetical protein
MIKNYYVIINILLVGTFFINSYHNEPLNRLKHHINHEYLHKTTVEIIKQKEKDKFLEKEFQHYLDTDKSVQKVLQINKEGTGEFSLEIIDFQADINKDLSDKSKELTDELVNAGWYKFLAQAAVLVGVSGLIGGGATGSKEGIPLFIGGGISFALGSYGWYHYHQKAKTLPTHIKAVNKMEEKWDNSFLVIKPKEKIQ